MQFAGLEQQTSVHSVSEPTAYHPLTAVSISCIVFFIVLFIVMILKYETYLLSLKTLSTLLSSRPGSCFCIIYSLFQSTKHLADKVTNPG